MTPDASRRAFYLPGTLLLSACAAVTSGACGTSAASSGDDYSVRDSAGVTIVEAGRPTGMWRLSAEPEVRIGMVDGEQPYLFDDVSFAGRLEDGGVVVANGGDVEIRYFGSDGRHRATLGRVGQGPGEFIAFGNVTMGPGDTLWIRDSRNPRITVVSPREEMARFYPVSSLDRGSGLRLVGPVGCA